MRITTTANFSEKVIFKIINLNSNRGKFDYEAKSLLGKLELTLASKFVY